jgi:hypothetical protein
MYEYNNIMHSNIILGIIIGYYILVIIHIIRSHKLPPAALPLVDAPPVQLSLCASFSINQSTSSPRSTSLEW